MPDAQPACRVCGVALEGREIYEGICAACHEDEVLGRTPKAKPSRPQKKPVRAPAAAPHVDMDADTREIVPLADSGERPPAEHEDEFVISLDMDTPVHGVEPLDSSSPSGEETPGPEMLSLVSSSPAMEIPAGAIPDLPLAEEPELPLDVENDAEPPPSSLLRPPSPVIPAVPRTDGPAFDLRLHDDDDSPSPTTESPPEAPGDVQTAPGRDSEGKAYGRHLAVQDEEVGPVSEEPLRLAPADQSGLLTAIDRLRGRLNVLESRTERLERRMLGSRATSGGGFLAALGFAVGLVVVLAVLAGLTALVGLTVYAPALDFLKRLLAGAFGG